MSRKVYCPCCNDTIWEGARDRHAKGGGWQHMKTQAARNVENLTSRLLKSLRKRKRGRGRMRDNEDDDEGNQIDQETTHDTFQPMDVDDEAPTAGTASPAPHDSDPLAEPTVIRTDPSPNSPSNEDDLLRPPSLMSIDDDDDKEPDKDDSDVEPELYDMLLMHVELSPEDLLRQIFESEEANRGAF
ncbi:hypothetical protein FB45DRAFT_871363 [Roridomyces roridus]|uniref:Uncharacterized protein n=1 Tax=Roridomyces roridus TaxID=1738132 RepID=A0AAD7BGD6_9AGAR|nr:hypothetical protein FB45DRAFT_871363 [Roridomyces roridus]